MILINLLKNGFSGKIALSNDSASAFDVFTLISISTKLAACTKFIKFLTFGSGCRLNTAKRGYAWTILLATDTFAKSINSSTNAFVSFNSYNFTSVGSCVTLSKLNRTSGDANVNAPLSIRILR